VTLATESMAGIMIGLDTTVVTTILPTIHTDLHANISALGWTVSAYSLACTALILTGTAPSPGLLTGRDAVHAGLGRVRVSPDVANLVTARAVQGAGGGVAAPLSPVLISEAYPLSRRGGGRGVGAITGISVGFGPVVGGAIVQGWPGSGCSG
jgi:MFS family permease